MTLIEQGKQVAVQLNEIYASRLDDLAKRGGMNRNHLMLFLVNIWLNVLNQGAFPGMFYILNLLRVRFLQFEGHSPYEHEFTGSKLPVKSFPIKLTEATIDELGAFANHNHITKHNLLKTMIIVGIEELEELTDRNTYQIGIVEPLLHKSFSTLMKKGPKIFKEFIK